MAIWNVLQNIHTVWFTICSSDTSQSDNSLAADVTFYFDHFLCEIAFTQIIWIVWFSFEVLAWCMVIISSHSILCIWFKRTMSHESNAIPHLFYMQGVSWNMNLRLGIMVGQWSVWTVDSGSGSSVMRWCWQWDLCICHSRLHVEQFYLGKNSSYILTSWRKKRTLNYILSRKWCDHFWSCLRILEVSQAYIK